MADPLLSTLRISILTIFMSVAARSDFDTLSVRDRHWIRWAAPVVLILLVEMTFENMGLANLCMVFSLVAAFSFCFTDGFPYRLELLITPTVGYYYYYYRYY